MSRFMASRPAIAATLLACAAACATVPQPNRPPVPATTGAGPLAPYIMRTARASDLAKLPMTSSAYEVVQLLNWSPLLRATGGTVSVFVNGHFFGGLETLRQIPCADIDRIDLLSATGAFQAFGAGASHSDGAAVAIQVRRGGPQSDA